MIRALGVNHGNMIVSWSAVSNGLVALSGAAARATSAFRDVQMGIGMLVWGLASVIMARLVGTRQLGFALTGAVMGSVLFRLLVAIALRWGVNPNDLKLITAIFVFAALILPGMIEKMKHQRVPGKGGQPAGA